MEGLNDEGEGRDYWYLVPNEVAPSIWSSSCGTAFHGLALTQWLLPPPHHPQAKDEDWKS